MFRGMYRGSGQGGGSGGDQHNLGWYATQSALETAHPTAEAGDWAIVGSTDTVWIWDTDTNAWKDSDQKGQVASVNGQTGTVVLTASDVGAATATQGAKADTAVQPADLATVATTGDYDDLTNKPTIPAAQVNSDWNASSGVAQILNKPTLGTMAAESASDYTKTANLATVATTGAYSDLSGTPTIPDPTQVSTLPTASATEEGKIYQFIGTTTASYTNGYFYKCVSDGATPAVYSWERVDVQPAPVIPDPLPSQTGQSGKFLTTDGSSASWSDKPLVNNAIGTQEISVGGVHNSYYHNDYEKATAAGTSSEAFYAGVAVGYNSKARGRGGVAIGTNSYTGSNWIGYGVAIGYNSRADTNPSIAIGYESKSYSSANTVIGNNITCNGMRSIVLYVSTDTSNSVVIPDTVRNKFIVGFQGNYYEMLDGTDGTIPAARHAALPSADGTYVLKLVIANGVPTLSWVAE